MDTKISLTFYDIVSHLIPGTALLLSFRYFGGIQADLPSGEITLFIVFGYIVGLFLHLLGLLLFKPYYFSDFRVGGWQYVVIKFLDAIISRTPLFKVKRVDAEVKKELEAVIRKKFKMGVEGNRLGLFSIVDTYVAALPYAERDILAAKEGVFRSLAVLVIIEVMYLVIFVFPDHKLELFSGGVFLLELCRYGREYYRTIKNQQIYTLALIKLRNDKLERK